MISLDMDRYVRLGDKRRGVLHDWLRAEGLIDALIVQIDVLDESGCALRCTAYQKDDNGRYIIQGDEVLLYEFSHMTSAPFPISILDPRAATQEVQP